MIEWENHKTDIENKSLIIEPKIVEGYVWISVPPLHLIRDNLYLFLSILTFIPQYLVITVSEIMVSVTGVEWAYTEAPPSMKARDPLTIG